MTLNFKTPQDRILEKVNILLFGQSGVGKTYSARYLDPNTTLFIDGEAGTLSLGAWPGDVLDIRSEADRMGVHPFDMCQAIACVLGGPDPQAEEGPYSKQSFDMYNKALGPGIFDKYDTIYLDSCTVVSRWSYDHAKKQKDLVTTNKGKIDTRAVYGVHGTQMIDWAVQLQHQPKNIILSCILEEKEDDFSRTIFAPQIKGGMAGREIPGIFDIVLTLAKFPADEDTPPGQDPRWFITKHGNPHGFPAKDRSGVLDPYEHADLGKLIEKVKSARQPK